MKILITTEWYVPVINGVVTSVVTLQKELKKLGHEVRILTLSNKSYRKGEVTYISSVGAGKIYPGARIALSIDNKYMDELINWAPDIIHSQCEFSTFRMARYISKKLTIPIVHTYHTVYEDYTHYFSPYRKWGKAMVAVFSRKVLKNVNVVITPTKKVQHLLEVYGIKQPIYVVPTGIDVVKFINPLSELIKKKIKFKHGINANDKVLICVGRLAKEKNIEELILYISRLKSRTLKFLIVGDGPHRSSLEEYAKKLNVFDNIIFTGMVPPEEIAAYYQIGDVFVSASNSETQGLTYVEALASGLPALCRKDPCLDGVIMDGFNGWQYTTFQQFRERLHFLLNEEDLHQQFSENARTGVIQDYSSTNFVKKIESIYSQVCQETANHF